MTSYGMLISDWSSDVCSSDLLIRSGPLIELPYGTVNIAAGAEYREESYSQIQDNAADYETQTPPFLPPKRKVSEVYGEIGIPLLKELPLIYSLDVEAAVPFSARKSVVAGKSGSGRVNLGGRRDI